MGDKSKCGVLPSESEMREAAEVMALRARVAELQGQYGEAIHELSLERDKRGVWERAAEQARARVAELERACVMWQRAGASEVARAVGFREERIAVNSELQKQAIAALTARCARLDGYVSEMAARPCQTIGIGPKMGEDCGECATCGARAALAEEKKT